MLEFLTGLGASGGERLLFRHVADAFGSWRSFGFGMGLTLRSSKLTGVILAWLKRLAYLLLELRLPNCVRSIDASVLQAVSTLSHPWRRSRSGVRFALATEVEGSTN